MTVRNLGPLPQRDREVFRFSVCPALAAEERRVPVKLKAFPVWGSTLVQEFTVEKQIFKAQSEGVKITSVWLLLLP